MTDIVIDPTKCLYWRCDEPPAERGICAYHLRSCRKCGASPYGSRVLTRGYCVRCYSWWRRHKSKSRPRTLAWERERAERVRRAKGAPLRNRKAAS